MRNNPVCQTEREFRDWFDKNYERFDIKELNFLKKFVLIM